MPKEFIMRGKTPGDGSSEILNFGGLTPGIGYQLIEFQVIGANDISGTHWEITASVTADNTAADSTIPDFTQEGLIGTVYQKNNAGLEYPLANLTIINDLFVITQDCIIQTVDTQGGEVNWQLKFREVKLSPSAEAVANYKQFTIYTD
tara:strand:+ start:64 stop:507 length:444 start_codon:yes stop_codon:yes gene_type:complete